jgi:hypothetical protein
MAQKSIQNGTSPFEEEDQAEGEIDRVLGELGDLFSCGPGGRIVPHRDLLPEERVS